MSLYDATVPAFLQILGSLNGLLTKAEAHCEAKKIQPEVLLNARLYPDMLPLTKQVQIACDFAANPHGTDSASSPPRGGCDGASRNRASCRRLIARIAAKRARQSGGGAARRVAADGLQPDS